jgi:hypothetical protein
LDELREHLKSGEYLAFRRVDREKVSVGRSNLSEILKTRPSK